MLKTIPFIILMILTFQFAEASNNNDKEIWNGYNNPFRMNPHFLSKFAQLPLEGFLYSDQLAWPGSYWPNYKGSIAWRWNSTNPQNFRYNSPNLSQARLMSKEKINALSPAEKYDLYMGDFDYPTVKYVWNVTSPRSPSWYGICHGVAPASIHHQEPKSVIRKSKDGIDITFYSSDIKGLLAHHYARVSSNNIIQIGKRCYLFGFGCSDINAGSFHIILANKLGITHTGFIADIDRGKQVWNHAPVSYQTIKLEEYKVEDTLSESTETRIRVQTQVQYAGTVEPAQTPMIGTDNAEYYIRDYQYYLDLNTNGEIIGGSWISWQRPDFVWYQEEDIFRDYWAKLLDIYEASIY